MLNKFVKHVSFPLIAHRDGFQKLPGIYRKLQQNQYVPSSAISAWQFKRLKKLLTHAYRQTQFYRKRFDAAGFHPDDFRSLNDLQALPVLTKSDINNCIGGMVADNYCTPEEFKINQCRDKLEYAVSGGTTGTSLGFYNDKDALEHKFAAQLRFDTWSGWGIGDWMGILWPAVVDRHHSSPSFKGRLKNFLSFRNIMLQQAVIEEADFRRFFDRLEFNRAMAIRGFPFQVAEAANFCRSNNIRLNNLKGIITTGEPLYPDQRQRIEEAFGCPVFDSYRTREVGCIAQECEEHNGYHISAESVLVETVTPDAAGKLRNTDHGEEGKIIVTDLVNYGMPFIRYEIGDIGVLSNRACACGRGLPLLESIGGRISDLLFTPDKKKVSPVTIIPNMFHLIGILNQFRIIQDRYDHITIQMVRPEPSEKLLRRQGEAIESIFGPAMQVSYEYVEHIAPLKSGKYSFVVSRIEEY